MNIEEREVNTAKADVRYSNLPRIISNLNRDSADESSMRNKILSARNSGNKIVPHPDTTSSVNVKFKKQKVRSVAT